MHRLLQFLVQSEDELREGQALSRVRVGVHLEMESVKKYKAGRSCALAIWGRLIRQFQATPTLVDHCTLYSLSKYRNQYSGCTSITTFRVQPGKSSSGSSNAQAASSPTSPFAPGVPTIPVPPRACPFGVPGVGAGVPSLEFGLEPDSACSRAWSWWGGAGAVPPVEVEMGKSSWVSISMNLSSSIFFLRSNSFSSSYSKSAPVM